MKKQSKEDLMHQIDMMYQYAEKLQELARELTFEVKQGVRLQAIEEKPGKRWDTVIACIITGLVSAAISAAVSGFVR